MPKIALLMLLALGATLVSAQTYKWRDADGRIQYSDTPPPPNAKDVQKLRKSSGPASPAPAAGKSLADQDAEFRKRLVEKQEAQMKQAKAAEEQQERARNCTQARGQLAAIESGMRLVQLNEKGERIPMEDADRERAKADAQKAVDTWCK